ncbi:hypothetical protein PV11_02337 [Exophiala sideris]|uniref:Metallo-beta-lactamase domain-containing protein n=1 Tax=Exophiala sideris TaxID=1016849 RepID=A0A0D1YW03_9EURO|nr:hypothetical protein PV11_02337 [Exophiala sideris]
MTCVQPFRNDACHGMRVLLSAKTTTSVLVDSFGHLRPPQQQVKISTASYQTWPLRNSSARIKPYTTGPSKRGIARPPLQTCPNGRRCLQTGLPNRASYSSETPVAKQPNIHDVFESKTGTWQYVVADPSSSAAVIIDPVLDYDAATQKLTTQAADSLLALVKDKGYKVEMILETHAHADHLSAASYLQKHLTQQQGHKPPIGIGKRIGQVQKMFGQRYAVPAEEYQAVFDKLFDDDETFNIGGLTATAIHLPGHTPDHMGYKIGDNVFCGDTIFHADIGSARCDFPGGSANDLYGSLRKLLGFPEYVKIWTGHDYPPEERGIPVSSMSVGDHRAQNKHIKDGVTEDEFVSRRKERDSTLAAPKLLHPSLQTNIRAGRLPKPNESGQHILHLPLNVQSEKW